MALDSLDILWSVPVGRILVGPALDQDTLSVVTEEGVLRAIDTQRRTETGSLNVAAGSTGLVVADGIIVISGDAGIVAYPAP